jgi:hypothetical protein
VGTEYQGEHFGARAGLGLRWNLNADTYSEGGSTNPGTAGLGAQASWDYGDFSARVSGGFGFEVPDTTGLYRAAGMEGGEQSLPLVPENSFISEAPGGLDRNSRAGLVYRNYREDQIGGPVLKPSDWEGATTVSGKSGPYPVRDPALASQVLTAEFNFDSITTWTGFQVPLEEGGGILEGAKLIEVPFRLEGFDSNTVAGGHGGDFTVMIQFGPLQDQDQIFTKYPAALVEKQIYPPVGNAPNNPAAYGEAARIALIQLSDEDRRKMRGATFMRLLILKNPGSASFGGRVMLAPPIVQGASFRAVFTSAGQKIVAADDPGQSPGAPAAAGVERGESGAASLEAAYGDLIHRLHPSGGQRVLELAWENLDANMAVGADGRTSSPLPLSGYRTLNFFVRGPDAPAGTVFRFLVARGPESWERRGSEIFLEAEIPLEAIPPHSWSKVELRYGDGGEVRVNNSRVSGARLNYHPAGAPATTTEEGSGGYLLFLLDNPGGAIPAGNLAIDEIILEEPVPAYQVSGGAMIRWGQQGTLVSIRGLPVIEDVSLETTVESNLRGPSAGEVIGLAGRGSGKTTILGTKVQVNAGLNYQTITGEKYTGNWNAGHGISRSFGPLSVGESFSLFPGERSVDHRFALELTPFGSTPVPLNSRLSGETAYQDESRSRRWDFSLDFPGEKVQRFLPGLALDAQLAWAGKDLDTTWLDNYGESWVQTWALLVPDLGEGETSRNIRGGLSLSKEFGPLGTSLLLEGRSAATVPQTQSESLIRLDVPLRPYGINFRGERNFLRSLRGMGNNSNADMEIFGASLKDSSPLWFSVPFYVLGDPTIPQKQDESATGKEDSHEYSRFKDSFSVSLILPARTGLSSLWTPAGISAGLGRTTERKLDTSFDLLDLNGTLRFTGVNLLGAWGVKPLFPFYASDEFDHGLEAAIAFPKNEDIFWRAGSIARLGFFGFSGGNLGLSNRFSLGKNRNTTAETSINSNTTPLNWMENLELKWTRPSKKGLLKTLWDYGMAALGLQDSWLVLSGIPRAPYEARLTERLELILDHSGEYLRLSALAGHESHIIITGRLDFSVFGEIGSAWDEKTNTFSMIFSIGTGLRVSF